MRLIRLHVEHFGPVRHADLEFGPGLNVLYGQNDLGKSYLARAIRAALLLPHTSTAHQEFVAWGTDETPRVELTFEVDLVFWRVKKAFGKTAGAAATLERSPNGEQWQLEAKGRDVDGQLRRLLEWGIPEPGGKGKPRGLPDSFLTQVLLAEQGSALDVFDKSLLDDPDESGKKLLGQALQALTQDPLFKSVLERSQQRVDEAFLATGNKRRGRNDPFPRAAATIRDALEEHERRKQQLEETQRVQDQIRQASFDRLEAQAARAEAAAAVEKLEAAWKAHQEQGEMDAKLAEAEARVVKKNAAEMDEAALAKALAEREKELAEAQDELKQAEVAAEQARERQRAAQGDEAAHRRELEREQLEKRRLELEAAERDARARLEAAEQAGAQAKAITELESEIKQREAALEAVRKELAALAERQEALEAEREQLRGVGAVLRWGRAVNELEEATTARDRMADLRKQAAELRAAGEAAAGKPLPSTEDVRALRDLARELEIAEARLDVGLSVRLSLKRATDLVVSADGAPSEKVSGEKGEKTFDAERSLVLHLGDLARLDVAAGAAEARREAEALARRWRSEGAPALEAAGVKDIDALEALSRGSQERAAEASRLETQAAGLAELAGQVAARQARLEEREAAIEGYDQKALEVATKLGEDAESDLEARQRQNEDALQAASAKRESKRAELDRAENDLGHLKKELEAAQRRQTELTEALDGAWERALAAAQAELARLTKDLQTVTSRRRALDESMGAEATQGRAVLEAAEKRLEAARAAVAERTAARDTAKSALESKRGQLEVLRENAAKVDLPALRAAFGEARASLEAVVVDGEPISEERLVEARKVLEEREAALAEKSREVAKLQGALEQVGGDVAVEREKMALEALLLAKEKERELELEYGSWRLLVDTLREAENDESSHLGRALVGPVSRRFSELTGGRYGQIGLDQDLRTTGVRVGGDERGVASLSQGLKEQLATIFRISVAQHLESMIVLDDHLTHTDPGRLGWFRAVLRKCGEEIQIVVFTCRPGDYLLEGEMGEEGVWNGSGGRLRGVDLEGVMDRVGSLPA